MKRWSSAHSLAAGLALLALANAAALLGVAYNRSAASDGLLHLSERELRLPTGWSAARDNSGIALRIEWQSGNSQWLDRSKLQALGFDVSGAEDTPAARRRMLKQLPREVLLVMEFDGPAYQASLSAAREEVARSEVKLASDPQNRAFKAAAGFAKSRLEYEERGASRLYVVDAGLDAAALRAKYPDRSHYAIVQGTVALVGQNTGRVSSVSISEINVPAQFRRVFEGMPRTFGYVVPPPQARYQATVAYGRRLEPWITAVSREPSTH